MAAARVTIRWSEGGQAEGGVRGGARRGGAGKQAGRQAREQLSRGEKMEGGNTPPCLEAYLGVLFPKGLTRYDTPGLQACVLSYLSFEDSMPDQLPDNK